MVKRFSAILVILVMALFFTVIASPVSAATITGLRNLNVNEQVTVKVSGLLIPGSYYWVVYQMPGYNSVDNTCIGNMGGSYNNILNRTVGPLPAGQYELQVWQNCPGQPTPPDHTQVTPPGSGSFQVGTPTGPAPGGSTALVSCAVGSTTYNNCIATAIGDIPTDPAGFVQFVLQWAIGIAGGIAFLLMLMGAVQVITSQGNPEQLQTGKDHITSAVTGLIFITFSVVLLKIIGVDILGIPGFQ